MKLNAEHVAVESEEGPVASHRLQPDGAPLPPPSEPKQERRKLQQPGGTPLPPPSGTCPDVRGVQQGLDATDARVDALEVYTDVSAAPRGLIGLWSGAYDTVPQGWALCDGTNGTPDLRDKFVVGAGSKYELGSSADVGSFITGYDMFRKLSTEENREHRDARATRGEHTCFDSIHPPGLRSIESIGRWKKMARGSCDKKVPLVAVKEGSGGGGLQQARKPPRNVRRRVCLSRPSVV